MTLRELLGSREQGTKDYPSWALTDLLGRRDEPLNAKFNPSGIGPGMRYGDIASIIADFLPGVGDANSAIQSLSDFDAGNYGNAAINAAGILPMLTTTSITKKGIKKLLSEDWFHGTDKDFDKYNLRKLGLSTSDIGSGGSRLGPFFTNNPDYASDYAMHASGYTGHGANVRRQHVSVSNPAVMYEDEFHRIANEIGPQKYKKQLISQGYDSALLAIPGEKAYELVVFDPRKIK